MATITKRGPKQWQAKVRKRGYRQVSKTFSTKARAERWATIVESKMEQRTFVDSSASESTTFGAVSRRYQSEILQKQKSMHEAPFRLRRLQAAFGVYRLTAILPSIVAQYRDDRLLEVSTASVRKELLLLRRVLEQARKEWGFHLPLGNPVSSIKLPRESRARDRRLTRSEEVKLMSAAIAYGGEIADVITFALETAARRSEILRLNWSEIDTHKRIAHFHDTKNGESRTIPLSRVVRKMLVRRPRNITGELFTIRPASVSQAFKRVRAKASIEDLRFHDLRHEATSRLFEVGLSLMEVAAITGHKDLAMLKRYTHLRAEELVHKLDAADSSRF